MATTPEPKGKLDTMTTPTSAAAAAGTGVVNGPEDECFDWRAVDWRAVEEDVRRLRQRIFTASRAGDLKRVRNLQKLMLRSRANTLLSVRRVTELNAGRKTAGIDGKVVLLPQAKAELADWAQHNAEPWHARPVKRVYIPKNGSSGKRRPLGIPVIVDRVLQARVVNALEPEWEARFESKSYGFRPGRDCHDAIEFKNGGREWRPAGGPEKVKVHDFRDPELGKANPYGIYDLAADNGWVGVGTDHDTAAFAVETIRRWWRTVGVAAYPAAEKLLITADGGGSNGYRTRLWKTELAALAAQTGLAITVCHLPPGTSKWNKIEHRLFSHISMNWRGRPLTSHQVIVDLIGSTTSRAGLTVRAELDTDTYPTGIKIPDKQINDLAETAPCAVTTGTPSGTTPSPNPRSERVVHRQALSPLREILNVATGPVVILAQELAHIDRIDSAFLYGSFAARMVGDAGPAPHGIDVMVLGEPDVDAIYQACARIEAAVHRPVNPTILTPEEFTASSGFLDHVRSGPAVAVVGKLPWR